MTASSVSVLVY